MLGRLRQAIDEEAELDAEPRLNTQNLTRAGLRSTFASASAFRVPGSLPEYSIPCIHTSSHHPHGVGRQYYNFSMTYYRSILANLWISQTRPFLGVMRCCLWFGTMRSSLGVHVVPASVTITNLNPCHTPPSLYTRTLDHIFLSPIVVCRAGPEFHTNSTDL